MVGCWRTELPSSSAWPAVARSQLCRQMGTGIWTVVHRGVGLPTVQIFANGSRDVAFTADRSCMPMKADAWSV